MEVVGKKISLEQFYSRQKSIIPFVGYDENVFYPSLNWGRIAYGVDFDKLVEEDPDAVETYGSGITQLGVMTYQELMSEYHRAVNDNGGYGDRELTEEEEADVEKLKSIVLFVDSKNVVDLPDPVPDPCCDPCDIPSPEWTPDIDDGDYYVEPYMCVDLCLVQSANLVGAYTLATKDWVPGMKYFAGDKVFYGGDTFRLKEFTEVNARIDGSDVDCEGNPFMPKVGFITASTISAFTSYDGLSDDIFNDFIVTEDSEVVDFGYIYAKKLTDNGCVYYIRPSWGGYFNKYDGYVYFDVLVDDKNPEIEFVSGETEHWELVTEVVSYGEYGVSGCTESAMTTGDIHLSASQERNIGFDDVTMTGLTYESKLVNFKRNTKTVTTDGVTLQGRLAKTDASKILDLEYLIGTVKNLDISGPVPIGDYLADITVTPDHNSLISIFHMDTTSREVTGRSEPHNEEYTYTKYEHEPGAVWMEPFKGSLYVTGDTFVINDEFGNPVFTNAEMPNDSGVYIKIGDKELIEYTLQHDYVNLPETGDRVDLVRDLYFFDDYHITINKDMPCNGEGFRIQPTAATAGDYDIIADKLLVEYDSGRTEADKYVEFQTLETYEKIVQLWATPTYTETGWITFRYYVGVELEQEKNERGEVEKDAEYIYNGGEKSHIYEDRYRFTARSVEAEVETTTDNVRKDTFVYLDIDYAGQAREVDFENLFNFRQDVLSADVTACTQSMTEGGNPSSVNFQNGDYFMEEYQMGVSFVANNNGNVYIDRGSATAFERHMRLSEVDTLQDLENYGNGMFKLKE